MGISNDAQLDALHAARVELGLPSDSVVAYLGGLRTIGSAVIIDGEIFRGANGGAGDFGHQNVDPAGPPDRCGRRGCLESLVGPHQLLTSSELLSAAEADQLVSDRPTRPSSSSPRRRRRETAVLAVLDDAATPGPGDRRHHRHHEPATRSSSAAIWACSART